MAMVGDLAVLDRKLSVLLLEKSFREQGKHFVSNKLIETEQMRDRNLQAFCRDYCKGRLYVEMAVVWYHGCVDCRAVSGITGSTSALSGKAWNSVAGPGSAEPNR
jgi:hypothetical protein